MRHPGNRSEVYLEQGTAPMFGLRIYSHLRSLAFTPFQTSQVLAKYYICPMIYLVGIIISFYLSILLITKKGKAASDICLAIWLFAIGIHMTLFYVANTGRYLSFPYFLGFEIAFPFLHGPFLFLYTSLLTHQVSKKIHWAWHFLPFVLANVVVSRFLFAPIAHKIYVYQHHGIGYTNLMFYLNLFVIASGVIYILLSLWLLNRHKQKIRNEFSDIDRINLQWLRYLIWGIGGIWLVIIFTSDSLIFIAVTLFTFFLGYFGIRQVGIFNHSPKKPQAMAPPIIEEESSAPKAKYEKSTLTDISAKEIHIKLSEQMESQQLFKDPELTLGELAAVLNVHPNTLSQVINSIENKNFYDYVNEKRVEELKRIIALPANKNFTLLSLAFDCGFNSKTSFNRNFKKATGLSPSEYLKQQQLTLA